MNEFYFSVNLDNERTLCLAPLTNRRIAMSGQEIDNPGGYFLYERSGSGDFANVEIIAHVVSEDAVYRLRDMFQMA